MSTLNSNSLCKSCGVDNEFIAIVGQSPTLQQIKYILSSVQVDVFIDPIWYNLALVLL